MSPRRKANNDQQEGQDLSILMLPSARASHKHEHVRDVYETPPGAVPHQVVSSEPLKRKLSAAEKAQQVELRKEHKHLATRHARYLDLLAEHGGNREAALAELYGMTREEVRPQLLDLVADVRRGLAVSPLGDLLEQHGLDLSARVNLLSRHAYSDNPAASLKSIDMVNELSGQVNDGGSFESFLRLAKLSKG